MRRLTMGTILALAMLVPGIRAVSALQSGPPPTTAYTVEPGDTLWSIARDVAPNEDPRAVVYEVMELNGLSSPSLLPGQSLLIPA